MAGGTTVTPRWEREGDFVPLTVGTAAITLGQVVEYDTSTAGTVIIGTDATAVPAGVAIAARRLTHGQTDNVIAVGEKIDVATKGIVNLTASAAAITIGGLVQCAGSGEIKALTISSHADELKIVGRALATTAGSEAIRVRLSLL